MLKSLGGISQAKGHEREFEKTESCENFSHLDVVRVDRKLVINPHEISFVEDGTAGKMMGIVLYV